MQSKKKLPPSKTQQKTPLQTVKSNSQVKQTQAEIDETTSIILVLFFKLINLISLGFSLVISLIKKVILSILSNNNSNETNNNINNLIDNICKWFCLNNEKNFKHVIINILNKNYVDSYQKVSILHIYGYTFTAL
jgi:hypothetical protein